MKQEKTRKLLFGYGALTAVFMLVLVAIIGLANTISRISESVLSRTPDAVLASAGLDDGKVVSVPVTYYDQRMDECVNMYEPSAWGVLKARQFEWSKCGYHNKKLEQGLVKYDLGSDYLPVAVSGKGLSNRNIDMARWFGAVDGKSAGYTGSIDMKYNESGAVFEIDEKEFYPLDEMKFSDGDIVNIDGHNHLFTMDVAVPFNVLGSGAEEFSIAADDDTFVFVGDKLVIDMGGIHDAIEGKFVVRENGEIYSGIEGEDLAYSGINVAPGDGAIIRIFHADRDSDSSMLTMKFVGMDLSLTNAELADGGMQVAYDPSNPTYVAPLGESMEFRPDSTKALVLAATIEGVAVVAMAVLMMFAVRFMIKQK